MRLLLAAALACLLTIASADAHTRSQSQSRWSLQGQTVAVHVEADAVDVTRLYALGGDAPLDEMFASEVAQAFRVSAAGAACAPDGEPQASISAGGRAFADWSFTCPEQALAQGSLQIESRLFLRVAASHLHFVTLRDSEGRTAEAVLTEPHPRAVLTPTSAPEVQPFWETVAHFIPIGAEHVWTGLDHVAFIMALVLVTTGRLRQLVFAVTGFTLGHTATLGLAAIGAIRPDSLAVEALIGFTIAFVALEIGQGGPERMRKASPVIALALMVAGVASLAGLMAMSPLVWFGLAAFVYAYPRGFPRGVALIALIFGLIHGCGFAGALAELELPRPRLLAALLGFNVGVELGQLTVVAAMLAVGFAFRRAPGALAQHAIPAAGAALMALGTFWFISRLV